VSVIVFQDLVVMDVTLNFIIVKTIAANMVFVPNSQVQTKR
tara:strand:- start:1436 stop:1558 length:123 start_codon:yes stop_codon:yes gene_type:complete